MPKRQKTKVVSNSAPINKPTSARKVKRIADQNERAASNRENMEFLSTPWEMAKDKRRQNRIAQGVRAKWRKANRSSIGEKPSVNNLAY